ncbi:hypothetical protein NC99_31070 [Sunxiuqinia dokdonensis]|uniref:Uncharacterized protein n=1 Tax=Sunxiuqinia dokdonensis TaxID=1409788 RepID=A0A0L8V6P2_9BACT|nr:hypothetical protein NC99_31070 [Sunxiuqinia dokdonensis]
MRNQQELKNGMLFLLPDVVNCLLLLIALRTIRHCGSGPKHADG